MRKWLKNSKILMGMILVLLFSFVTMDEMRLFGSQDINDPSDAVVDEMIPKLMMKYNVPGVAVATLKQGTLDWSKGYGWANRTQKVPMTTETVFQVASNSKTIAAWGVMKLVQKGVLELDAPVEQYLTRWHFKKSKYETDRVTIRRVLSHTAGLSQGGYAGYSPDKDLPSIEASLRGEVSGVTPLKVIQQPGKKYKYSGGGYTLLQLIIEEVTGMPFEQYMQDEILIPLEMNHSAYTWEQAFKEKTATPYGVLGNEVPLYQYTEKAAAGLYTTVLDFSKFIAMNLNISDYAVESKKENEGQDEAKKDFLLSPSTLESMFTAVDEDEDYGLGYIIEALPKGKRLIYHGGTNRGWRSQFGMIPETGSGIVIFTNSDNGKNLHMDLLDLWTKQQTGDYPKDHLKNIALRVVVKGMGMFLCILLLAVIFKIMLGVHKKDRIIVLFQQKTTSSETFKIVLKCILFLLIPVVWCIAFYTGLIYKGWTLVSFAPFGFVWITISIFFISVFLIISCLCVRRSEVMTSEKL